MPDNSGDDVAARIGKVAHDLRSPLANISSFADLLSAQLTDLDEQQAHMLERIRANAARAISMLDDLAKGRR